MDPNSFDCVCCLINDNYLDTSITTLNGTIFCKSHLSMYRRYLRMEKRRNMRLSDTELLCAFIDVHTKESSA